MANEQEPTQEEATLPEDFQFFKEEVAGAPPTEEEKPVAADDEVPAEAPVEPDSREQRYAQQYDELVRQAGELHEQKKALIQSQRALEEYEALRAKVQQGDVLGAIRTLGISEMDVLDKWGSEQETTTEGQPQPKEDPRLAAVMQELEQVKQALIQQQTGAARSQVIEHIRGVALAEDGEGEAVAARYPVVAALAQRGTGALDKILAQGVKVWEKTRVQPDYNELVRTAEEEWTKNYEDAIAVLKTIPKFAKHFQAQPETPQVPPATRQPSGAGTLTNRMTAESATTRERELTDEEAEQEFIKTMKAAWQDS